MLLTISKLRKGIVYLSPLTSVNRRYFNTRKGPKGLKNNPTDRSECNSNNTLIHRWVFALQQTVPSINVLHGFPANQYLNDYISLVSALLNSHGEARTIEKLKSYRTSVQQVCLKQTINRVPFTKSYKDGFPRKIKWLRPKGNCIMSKRYSLSMLRVIELFRCSPSNDIATIVEESTANKDLLEDIIKFIPKCRLLKNLPDQLESYLVMSNKAGPNGPCTLSAVEDLNALRKDPRLYHHVTDAINKSNLSWLNYNAHKTMLGPKKFIHSKIVFMADRACKTRLIAIADWWSNVALSGLHSSFLKALFSIKEDFTYRQETIPQDIKDLGKNLYSTDMTAFTDRFPRKLLKEVIKAKYGDTVARNWEYIVGERKFTIKDQQVKYTVGTPMGVLSSWSVSTFTHHLVKRYCLYKLNIQNNKYRILGDDTVDTNKALHSYYIKTIQGLGISISAAKSTQSENGYVEIAKRLFGPDGEYTGIPVYLLQEIHKMPEQFLELVRMLRERGYEDSYLGPVLLNLLSSRKFSKSRKIISDLLSLPESMTGTAPLLEVADNTWACEFEKLSDTTKVFYLEQARNKIFWKTALTLDIRKPDSKTRNENYEVLPTHPIIFALSIKCDKYLEGAHDQAPQIGPSGIETEDEFSIYNAWMRGEYRSLSLLPSVDTYKYYSPAHKVTKCKYEVLKLTLELARSENANDFLYPLTKLSDYDLYDIAFEGMQNSLGL